MGKGVALVISSLSTGGAERALVLLARGFAERGHRLSVVTLFGKDHDFYAIPAGVDRRALDLAGVTRGPGEKVYANLRRTRGLRLALAEIRPDVVISFMTTTNVLAVLACRGWKTPVVVTEHVDSRRQRFPWPWRVLRRLVYPRAARLVSVSPDVDGCFHWLPARQRAVIANPIRLVEIDADPAAPVGWSWPRAALAMGRLEPEKGFDLLIEAFGRLAARFPDWGLMILGEGSLRRKLEDQVTRLGLAGRARLAGAVHDPFPTLCRADLFVMPSRYEAFPMALVEAMACRRPVVATACWDRSPGIVANGIDGVLVSAEDIGALERAMGDLMADEAQRRRLGDAARRSAERFDLGRVMPQWEQLLGRLG
jgi:GalNAc-alpha-(1->4)-GalNAc-alpha-(1->3)-diNAcBac-PP-undecaprenol alpha-1,4-N-acetyl-D-galactosaminyltransferase